MNTAKATFVALAFFASTTARADIPGDAQPTEQSCGTWKLIENIYQPDTSTDYDRCIAVTTPVIPGAPVVTYAAGEGNSRVFAGGFLLEGDSRAWDRSTGCDITVVATAGGQFYEKWEFKPTQEGAKGEASVDYTLKISGSLNLKNASCAASIYAFVHFTSNLGVDEALELNHGKATGSYSPGSAGVTGPHGVGVTLNIETGTNEGEYPAPAIPDINGATDPKCVKIYTLQHRTMGYLETWADGGWFELDLGEATSEVDGSVNSTHVLGECCDGEGTGDDPDDKEGK